MWLKRYELLVVFGDLPWICPKIGAIGKLNASYLLNYSVCEAETLHKARTCQDKVLKGRMRVS